MSYHIDAMGIHRPETPVIHRNDEYNEHGFKTLLEMQDRHFWYLGRHRFLLAAMQRWRRPSHRALIDLGGGVGGWIKYLSWYAPLDVDEIALGDSSEVALVGAKGVLPPGVGLYQVDLMDLHWEDRWDLVFLLDVMEHCPDDVAILKQVRAALRPGGLLFVTTPALMHFWSYNDEHAGHLRRYNIADFRRLAAESGFRLLDARYFMFFLSPLYWLSRKLKPENLSKEQIEEAIRREHQVPGGPINFALTQVFLAESWVGHKIRFPWGTSILGVFEDPG